MHRISKQTYESILVPYNSLVLIGIRVGEPLHLTALAAKETMEGWSDLVAFVGSEGVTLCTASLGYVSVSYLVDTSTG